ncbi:glycoside hydrolase [Vibrio sagamiensis]|uniref:Glycosyl hydrolase n=1 Tax=Vibrio sagamiensis NBRC 104589 TaxID=1219064 RepID=A0A511QJS3_9VIBR|nr:glycosyl hydrolase [Vibrio agarivorans]GEM77573.1 hypothetical protein VSA01S_36850 [Vibrio sagamiensis NBRC 104589]
MSLNKLAHSLLCSLPFFFSTSNGYANTIKLKNANDFVLVSPQTLAIEWNNLSINQPGLHVEQKMPQSYQILAKSDNTATWQIQPSGLNISASLINRKLSLSLSLPNNGHVSRQHPIDVQWFNLDQSKSQTLYLPFSEGMRVPLDNSIWANFLINNYSGANTTQDLKMPFWTVKQGGRFINYMLTTPTNNALTFNTVDGRIDMSATHQFTQLSAKQSLDLVITLGDSPLSGAVTYRQYRQKTGLANPLTNKLSHNKELKKLIGASHVYLFGTDPLSINDVKDWWGLKDWYIGASGLTIPSNVKHELLGFDRQQGWFSQYHKQLLLDSISNSMTNKFNVDSPTLSNNTIGDQYHAAQSIYHWLEQHAGDYLVPPSQWGQALSSDMLDNLKQAGVNKLWLGFENWMPSFYHPEITQKAKQQGFLVGVYDSYNTALMKGSNDSWLTANLPEEIRLGCAIELANGEKTLGFRGNGFYLNPNCHLNYVKKRMLDIARYGQFNSVFLDVDATAMAREDYRDNTTQTAMLTAYNQRLGWLAEQKGIILGSEDGNSLTSTGIAFAHGLETVGFGWTDIEMTKNHHSQYYLGRWYPGHKPAYFFKAVQVKEPYRTLLFAPQYRVPLYQAVFHDEIINTHHWHSDSLKFSNVKTERDLIAMLYNTPAMVHLTRDEALSVNSERITQLKHYQDGFSPIHQQLWDQALISHSWLDKRGNVQQTTFSDGSTITANFKSVPFQYNGTLISSYSILAKLANGNIVKWQSR